MIRIITAEESACITITADGDLWGDSLAVVEICCNQAIAKGKPVRLFLRDVPVLGEDGRRLLCRLAAKGIDLKATGVYNSYIVDSILSDDPANARCRARCQVGGIYGATNEDRQTGST